MAQNTLFMQGRQLPAGTGSNPGATVKDIINIPKIWAAVNRKNAAVTDTKGYLNTYICKVEVVSTDVLSYLYTAPENWVLKNGVRKWHIARNAQRVAMFGDRGVQTTYGRTIRPKLHSGHQTTDNAADYYELLGARRGAAVTGGHWTFTQMAHEPGVLNSDGTAGVNLEEASDDYYLCLTGNSVLESGHDTGGINKYSDVSMTESYLLARRNFEGGSGGEGSDDSDITPTPSPLIELMGNTSSSVEVARIMDREMEMQPPYDLLSVSGAIPADATDLYYAGALRTTETYGRDSAIIRVPGGLLELHSSAQVGSAGSAPARLPFWNIEVLGVTRAEG
jgi:hypothetical protein